MAHPETLDDPATLGGIGEVAALARILPRLPRADAELLGPGDDCAVIGAPDARVVITTDLMVHGPDFRLAWSTPHDLGWKAAATNLSDIAAMGAVPTALVVAIAAPDHSPVALLEGIADGLRDACAALAPGCGVVGGDLSVSPTFTIAVTAFGDLGGRAPVTRSGARSGDIVAVSGALGDAAAGLALLFRHAVVGGEPDAAAAASVRSEHPEQVLAQLRPSPPISDGVLAALAGATAMIDLSDSLALDASRVARASGIRVDLESSLLVTSGGPRASDSDASEPRAEGPTDAESLARVMGGGEDHSLLATFPAGAGLPGGFRAIGTVYEGEGLTLDTVPWAGDIGWDPYRGWDGGAG